MNITWFKNFNNIGLLALLAVFIALPSVLSIGYLNIAITTLHWMFLCSAYSFVMVAGLFCLMSSVFYGIGAYVPALLWNYFQVNIYVGMIAGVIVAAIIAVAIGWLLFRTKIPPLTFGTCTLALTFVAEYIVQSTGSIASEGMVVRYTGSDPFNFQFDDKLTWYYIALAMVVGIYFLSKYLLNSKAGLYWGTVDENERLAEASGVNTMKWKLIVMALSAGLLSIAGTFMLRYQMFIAPSIVGPSPVIQMVLLTVIGGVGSIWGPLVGAGIFVPIGELIRIRLAQFTGLNLMVFGFAVVFVLYTLRNGLYPFFKDIVGRLINRHEKQASASL